MSDSNPGTRLIVTDRLCLEDLADDAVICLRRLEHEEAAAAVTDHGLPFFCIGSPFLREDLERAGLLRLVSCRAELSAILPIRSSDVILIVGSDERRLFWRQVSIELDQFVLPIVAGQAFESIEMLA